MEKSAIVTLTEQNLEQESICCALGDRQPDGGIAEKKNWLKARFKEGLVFKKLDVRGKVFIEYLPAEKAWQPIDAEGYMHINCLWVSGRYQGQGYASQLLDACIADSQQKGFVGLTVVSSAKKKPFLSDGHFLQYRGFLLADEAPPYFQLRYLPFSAQAVKPQFSRVVQQSPQPQEGLVLYYTSQCPFTHRYAQQLKKAAEQRGIRITLHHLVSVEQARETPAVVTSYALFYAGQWVTHEILSEKKITLLLDNIEHSYRNEGIEL